MDYETVLPFKTVNDIMKEVNESQEPEDSGDCENCSCGDK
jgi:hypothetical protein